jgi:hypothetical protein
VAATPKASSAVAYVFDFGTGSNDPTGRGFGSSIFVNALTGAAPNGVYHTADSTQTVTVTDVPVSTLDASGVGALAGFDTVILYQACGIGSHTGAMSAINTYLAGGGKVMIFDSDRCATGTGGPADYSTFLFPFATSSPGPRNTSGAYTNVVPSTLTTGLSAGPQPGDSVGDANIFTSFSGAWCGSITGTNTLGANGFVEATARAASGGLAIYQGEDFWFTQGPSSHLRLVFDDMLKQAWAPDGLPCTVPASGISLNPPSQTQPAPGTANLTGTVVDTNGSPVPGVLVTFKVTSGPNAGRTGSGTTDSSGNASFAYGSTVTGTDNVVASFADGNGVTHFSSPATVVWQPSAVADAPISAAGVKFCAIEGIDSSGTVATFTDPDTSATPAEYAATIQWGDGSSSAGTITGSGGKFTVSGSHSYADEGLLHMAVTITDVDTPANTATVSGTADVSDAALKAAGTNTVSPTHFSGMVATLTDANKTTSSKSDFKATINWGDGSHTSSGTVAGSGGTYTISGSHAYCHSGPYTIKVHIVDDGKRTANATSTVLIFKTARGGSFVIGDKSAVLGKTVTFWSASWWKKNSLSGGPGPASFKGFENKPAIPACGASWTAPAGSSAHPPATLPGFMAVVVTGSITQSGALISGNTVHVVVVRTNSGYAPNLGHSGTGTVVAVIC